MTSALHPPTNPPPDPAPEPLPRSARRADRAFQAKFARACTTCAFSLLFLLAVCFSEWRTDATDGDAGPRRRLDEAADYPSSSEGTEDYSASRCDGLFAAASSPSERCAFAAACEGSGLLLPFVFCSLSPSLWLVLLSPLLLLAVTLLFRSLGSTADEYFSPSLEMFSAEMGLPPRFAGVTLLALGNGAADVSATVNAIASDPESGYRMSLGALTGAAMFITTCVVGAVAAVDGGARCGGAAVRDVAALAVTVLVVGGSLGRGEVDRKTEKTFISIYVLFVLIVLIADIYHRAVMLPRLRNEAETRERERQLEAERAAVQRAGGMLDEIAGGVGGDGVGGEGGGGGGVRSAGNGRSPIEQSVSWAHPTPHPASDEDGTRSGAPEPHRSHDRPGNRALNAVLAALSNYDDEDAADENDGRRSGWGVDSAVEGSRSWDRPIVLHGSEGILAKHRRPHHRDQEEETEYRSPYRVMEDLDAMDRMCIQPGSTGMPAYNWRGAFQDSKAELAAHFGECWREIWEEEGRLERFLGVCEFPLTVLRKLTVAIPCEGSYCRPLIALSLTLSPLWFGFYLRMQFGLDLWDGRMAIFLSVMAFFGVMVIRYGPGGEGTMVSYFSVPIALYGFVVAATWIDTLADKLVGVLDFLGVVLRIPNSIMGLTVLAWGNSMADLSANVTMARKGLANMAITACFAGPVFNILVGLGAGFSLLRSVTKEEVKYVHLTPSITTGFVFCFVNCVLLLITGLVFNKGTITAGYGYFAIGLYALYIATSFVLQFLFSDE